MEEENKKTDILNSCANTINFMQDFNLRGLLMNSGVFLLEEECRTLLCSAVDDCIELKWEWNLCFGKLQLG